MMVILLDCPCGGITEHDCVLCKYSALVFKEIGSHSSLVEAVMSSHLRHRPTDSKGGHVQFPVGHAGVGIWAALSAHCAAKAMDQYSSRDLIYVTC